MKRYVSRNHDLGTLEVHVRNRHRELDHRYEVVVRRATPAVHPIVDVRGPDYGTERDVIPADLEISQLVAGPPGELARSLLRGSPSRVDGRNGQPSRRQRRLRGHAGERSRLRRRRQCRPLRGSATICREFPRSVPQMRRSTERYSIGVGKSAGATACSGTRLRRRRRARPSPSVAGNLCSSAMSLGDIANVRR